MKTPFVMCTALLLMSSPVAAQLDPHDRDDSHSHETGQEHHEIEEVVVRATPLNRNLEELSQSATVLKGNALQREASGSLGDTLARQAGLSNASFGQNVGRPVIRGMQGQRVGVLSNNMSSGDASAVSQDHAVSVEPFLADQIEVLRGPSTLLYGSGAIGGVVNTVTHTIPKEIATTPFSGRAMAQLDSAANERFAAGRLDMGSGSFAFHANGFYRRTDDYEIPGEAELYPDTDEHEEDHEEVHSGVLENSFLDNNGGALGGAWIGDNWRAGLSWTSYDSHYGIPGATHHHEEDEDEHEEELDEEEIFVTVKLETSRWDAELAGTNPFPGFEELSLRVAGVDYTHTEFEGDETGTVFDSDTLDTRLELRHLPWRSLQGVFGFQYKDVDFGAVGEEAFVPDSNTATTGLFWLESLEFDTWTIDLGLRYEDLDVKLLERPVSAPPARQKPRDTSPPFPCLLVQSGTRPNTLTSLLTLPRPNAHQTPRNCFPRLTCCQPDVRGRQPGGWAKNVTCTPRSLTVSMPLRLRVPSHCTQTISATTSTSKTPVRKSTNCLSACGHNRTPPSGAVRSNCDTTLDT